MTQNNKFVTWGGYFYEAPSVKVLDIQSEGMLCASDFDAKDWEPGQTSWFE